MTVKSIVLPGAATVVLRAVAQQAYRQARDYNEALRGVPYSDVFNNAQLRELRSFVDDVFALIEVVSDALPACDITTDRIDPGSGLERAHKTVTLMHADKRRAGAPARQRQ